MIDFHNRAPQTIHFEDETILITDSCYFVKDEEWRASDYGKSLKKFGFSNYLSKDTIYGDWFCTMFEEGTNKEIGTFSADSGNVCVVSLKQVLNYNPEFADTLKKAKEIATVLEHFTGDITYKTDYNKAYLVGKGNVNFRTEQTGC